MPMLFFGYKMRSVLINMALAGALTLALMEIFEFAWPVAWFGAINVVTFIVMGRDKLAATAHTGRTPEAALLTMAMLGGFPGLFAGRRIFNHKTSKASFITAMWFLFFVQLGAVAYFIGEITSLDALLQVIGVEKAAPAATAAQGTASR